MFCCSEMALLLGRKYSFLVSIVIPKTHLKHLPAKSGKIFNKAVTLPINFLLRDHWIQYSSSVPILRDFLADIIS